MLTTDPRFLLITERFPHIGQRLLAAWGHKGFAVYVDGLLGGRREGQGSGFPEEISRALDELRALHSATQAPEAAPDAPTSSEPLSELDGSEDFKVVDQRHPHIGKRLKDAWGSCLFSPFINELFRDSRGGTRQGFSREVSGALFRLQQAHDQHFPETIRDVSDIWSVNQRKD